MLIFPKNQLNNQLNIAVLRKKNSHTSKCSAKYSFFSSQIYLNAIFFVLPEVFYTNEKF